MSKKICYICAEEASCIYEISKDREEYICDKCRKKYFKPRENKK